MKKTPLGIDKIKYGVVHRFYPLKFESNKEFKELCESIQKSRSLFTDKYQKQIMDSLEYSVSQAVKKFQKEELAKEQDIKIKMVDSDKYSEMKQTILVPNSDIRIELESIDSSIKVKLYDMEIEELGQQIDRLQRMQRIASDIYGESFVLLHERYILLPFKAVLSSGESVWINATLYVFANGMGFIKIEIPLINIDTVVLKTNDLDSVIDKVTNKWGNEDEISKPTILDIVNIYMKFFVEDTGINFFLYQEGVNYISLINYDGIPKQINNVPKEVQEDLFRIIAAPVSDMKNTSFIKQAEEYIKKNSWRVHNINYLVKTTGGCLSYIDQGLIDILIDEYKEKADMCFTDDADYFYLYDNIAADLFINVEFTFLIVMLKKLNDRNCYIKKFNRLGELTKTQKEYNRNIMFICDLQEQCYGTVSEQLDFFEKSMCYYMKQDIMDKKLAALDNIIKDEEKRKEERFHNFLAIGGFLISLLFGLPAIYDTLVIIRKAFVFLPPDIPFLTLENISLFLWVVLNGVILIKVIGEYVSAKKKKYPIDRSDI